MYLSQHDLPVNFVSLMLVINKENNNKLGHLMLIFEGNFFFLKYIRIKAKATAKIVIVGRKMLSKNPLENLHLINE